MCLLCLTTLCEFADLQEHADGQNAFALLAEVDTRDGGVGSQANPLVVEGDGDGAGAGERFCKA